MGSESAGDPLVRENAEIALPSIPQRAQRPIEFGIGLLQTLPVVKTRVDYLGASRGRPEQRAPWFEKRWAEGDMLSPRDGPIRGREVLDSLGEDEDVACRREPDLPFKAQLSFVELGGQKHPIRDSGDLVGGQRRLAVNRYPGGGFLRTGRAECIQTDVVPQNAG